MPIALFPDFEGQPKAEQFHFNILLEILNMITQIKVDCLMLRHITIFFSAAWVINFINNKKRISNRVSQILSIFPSFIEK